MSTLGSLFGSPRIPKQTPPLMPDPNDPQILLAQRQKIAKDAAMRGGRMSTILSSGDSYSSTGL